MTRSVTLSLVIMVVTATTGFAKDVCIQVDEGGAAGSVLVLKVRGGKGSFSQIHGYHAFWDGLSFSRFLPVEGQALTTQAGDLVAGLERWNWGVDSNGTANTPSAHSIDINFRCLAGPNGKIDVLDSCPDLFFSSGFADSHVINCKEAPSLP